MLGNAAECSPIPTKLTPTPILIPAILPFLKFPANTMKWREIKKQQEIVVFFFYIS
jgi:hypothetical protein